MVLAGATLCGDLVGLRNVPTPYLSFSEMIGRTSARTKTLLDRLISQNTVAPPTSGFFLFLDQDRVGHTYAALQKDIVLASETTSEGTSTQVQVGGSAKALSGEFLTHEQVEHSRQMVPPTPTAQREAVWLISTYRDLGLAWDFFTTPEVSSTQYDNLLSSLAKDSVQLTVEQRIALNQSELNRIAAKVADVNVPLLFAGDVQLSRHGEELRVSFRPIGTPKLNLLGVTRNRGLDDSLERCLQQTNGCTLSARLWGIALHSVKTQTDVTVEFVPLAIW